MSSMSGVFYQRVLFSDTGLRTLTWCPPQRYGFTQPTGYYVWDVVADEPVEKLPSGDIASLDISGRYDGRTLQVQALFDNEVYLPADKEGPQAVYVPVGADLPQRDPVTGDVTLPSWFFSLPEQVKIFLLESDWFQSWRDTAVSLNVNPLRVWSDNQGRFKTLIWRTDRRVVFHGDEEGRPPAEVFRVGLTPPEVAGNLVMRPGEHSGAFESFSYKFGIVKMYATPDSTADRHQGYVYLASPPGGGVCVDLSLGGSPDQHEVAFPGGVAASHLLGAFTFPDDNQLETSPTRFLWSPQGPLARPVDSICLVFAQQDNTQMLTLRPEEGGEVITLQEEPWLLTKATGRYRADPLPEISGEEYGWFVNGALQMEDGVNVKDLVITLPDAAMNGILVIEWVNLWRERSVAT